MSKNLESSPIVGGQVGRRKFLGGAAVGAIGAATLPAVLAACGTSSTSGGSGGNTEGNFPSHPVWKFTFVNHVTTNAFFTPTQYGAADACAAFGCSYQWTGSANSVVSEMVNAMNAAYARIELTPQRADELPVELMQLREAIEAVRGKVAFDVDPFDFHAALLATAVEGES